VQFKCHTSTNVLRVAVTGLNHDADQQNVKEKEMTKETKKKEEHKIKEIQKMNHPRKEEEKREMAWRIIKV
jgi:type VI protein secretion system component VasA